MKIVNMRLPSILFAKPSPPSIALAAILLAPAVHAESLTLFGAGSLQEAMTDISHGFSEHTGIAVRNEFAPSGVLRERIENGAHADIFASADMGHPLKLRSQGRATQVAMFARNALCGIATPMVGLTTDNFLDKMLDPAVRVGTSTPNSDPAGDYTWSMFHLAERIAPGSYAVLDAKAKQIVGGRDNNAAVDGRDPMVAALSDGTIDIAIGYCTSARLRQRQMPAAQIVPLPASLHVGPEYGLAILSGAAPGARDLALFILSPEAQRTLAQYGFNPVGLPAQP